MSYRKKVNHTFFDIERVNYPIVANARSVTITSGEMVMGKTRESIAHLVDFCLDSCANVRWEFEKSSVEWGIVDLERRAHSGFQGFLTRGRIPDSISDSDCRIIDSNPGLNSKRSSTKLSNHSRTSFSSSIESFSSSFSICLTRLIPFNCDSFRHYFQASASASAKSPFYLSPPLRHYGSQYPDHLSEPDE